MKYKRICAEVAKEKERLSQAVRGTQHKIIKNLKQKKENLLSDGSKLYGEFRGAIDRDRRATSDMRKTMALATSSAAKSRKSGYGGRSSTYHTIDDQELMF